MLAAQLVQLELVAQLVLVVQLVLVMQLVLMVHKGRSGRGTTVCC